MPANDSFECFKRSLIEKLNAYTNSRAPHCSGSKKSKFTLDMLKNEFTILTTDHGRGFLHDRSNGDYASFYMDVLTYQRLRIARDAIHDIQKSQTTDEVIAVIDSKITANTWLSANHCKSHTNNTRHSGFFDINISKLSDALFKCQALAENRRANESTRSPD